MPNFTNVTIIGHLTRDPEFSHTPSNTAICKFGVAVNDGWGDTKHASFYDVVAWGKTAEFVNQYFTKGKCIVIGGELRQERWETDEGGKRQRVVIQARQVTFGAARSDDGQPATQAPSDEVPF